MKKTSRAKSIRRNGEQQDCDTVEQHSSVRDPGAHAQLETEAHSRDQQKTSKTKEATDFSKSEAELVDVMDHTPARDFNHREGDG